ncbi:MAG: S41 family peptidase [Gemmatimonadota bacterium]|nr:MAG: S41 family peptidase [Gemmatimonadota bacterium]
MIRYNQWKRFIALSFVVLLIGATFGSLLADKEEIYRSIRKNFTLFNRIYEAVSTRYVEEVNVDELMQASIKGMLDTLDPYTQYMEKSHYQELKIGTKGKFEGLGINIGIRGNILTVISPIEGTPAHRIGIQAGDKIMKIEGESTAGFTTAKAASLLRGPKGTQVTVTIEREGVPEPIDYTVTRDVIEVKSVSYAGVIDDGIGYIRLRKFSQHSGEEVKEALEEVLRHDIQGLIFDLRMNSGGLLSEAVDVTDKFLPKDKLIVSTKGRNGEKEVTFVAQDEPVYGDKPLVVLVDKGSASASEIFAGAIQDWDRGLLVGTLTFGKGLVQSVLPIGSDEALKITTAKYYTPSGRCIQKEDAEEEHVTQERFYTESGRIVYAGGGITPDIESEAPKLSQLESELLRKGLFLAFAAHYSAEHPDLNQDFDITEEILDQFQRFTQEKELSYKAAGFSEIEDLREIAQREQSSSAVNDLLDEFEGLIASEKEMSFERSAEFIKRRLKAQIALDVWGTERETEIRLRDDPQVATAIDLLKHPELYYNNLAVADEGE